MVAIVQWAISPIVRVQNDVLVTAFRNYDSHDIYQKVTIRRGRARRFYLDIIKESLSHHGRQTGRAAPRQTAMYHIASAMVRWPRAHYEPHGGRGMDFFPPFPAASVFLTTLASVPPGAETRSRTNGRHHRDQG